MQCFFQCFYFIWFYMNYSIEAPLGGVPPPPLVLADLLQELLFWPVSDKFLSSSCQLYWTAAALWDRNRKDKRTKCMIGKPSWQLHDSDAYFASASFGSLFNKCMGIFGKCAIWRYIWQAPLVMHIWQVYDLKIYLANAIWDAYLATVRFKGIFGKHHLGCIFGNCTISK